MTKKPPSYYKGRKCCICGNDKTYIRPNGTSEWSKYYDNIGNWTGQYMCKECYNKDYNRNHIDDRKFIANCWNKRIKKGDSQGEGLVAEAITAKVRFLKVLSIETYNFKSKFDLSIDKDYGRIQVKSKSSWHGDWSIYFGREHNFDTLFVLCNNDDINDGKRIERVYVIPEKELYGITGITILKNDNSKWEKFRLREEHIKLYNDLYKDLMECLKDNKYFGIEDIKKWL